MIQIQQAVLHILDFSHNNLELSENTMNEEDLLKLHFVSKQIEKLIESPTLKKGEFKNDSLRINDFIKYRENQMNLIELSSTLASDWWRLIKLSDKIESSSLMVADIFDNAAHLLVFLKYKNKNAFLHESVRRDGKLCHTIIENMSVLPAASSNVDECIIVNLETLQVQFKDLKRIVETQETYLIPDRLLFTTSALSQKEILTTIKNTAEDISDEYELDGLEILAKTKAYIQDKLNDDGYLRLNELAEEVFLENEKIGEAFLEAAINSEIPEEIRMHEKYANSLSKIQKMKTDTGIQISLPSIYYDDKDHFEIIKNDDNTLTIQIKNILYVK